MKQQLILEHLLQGNKLTTTTALSKFRTTELRKMVSNIKKMGFPVVYKWVKKNDSHFKIYYI